MRFITTQICDNPNGDEDCQYDDIGEKGAFFIFEPLGSALDGTYGEGLYYCDDCHEDVVTEFIMNEEEYPRLKEEDKEGYVVKYGEKEVARSTGYVKTDWAEIIYYSREVGNKLYDDIKAEGYCE